ncbi:VPS35 endosomal protein-sorting factor-like [Oncorhynchus nerka]|uniref:VPS35 endosomal protein-sorting factor-like n=1 Tax=Oncorhynchus nerka TaxID=8023 RepID=UPI0031B827B8
MICTKYNALSFRDVQDQFITGHPFQNRLPMKSCKHQGLQMIHASIILISSISQKREVNTVLSDIIKHIMPDRAFEDAYAQLQSVIRKILTYFHDFSIFSMERFLPFMDMSQKDSVRVEVCLSIMDIFIKHQQEHTRDPVILNALLHVCKTMHDSVK